MAEKDPRTQLLENLEKARVAMLTTVEPDGSLASRPMGLQEVEEDGTLWFITRASGDAAQDASAGRPVNVAVQDRGFWASVSGTGAVVRDDERKRRYWSSATEAFFGEGTDPEDPQIVLIRVDADSAEYWESAGAAASVVEVVKAKVTGGEAHPGENETVQF